MDAVEDFWGGRWRELGGGKKMEDRVLLFTFRESWRDESTGQDGNRT